MERKPKKPRPNDESKMWIEKEEGKSMSIEPLSSTEGESEQKYKRRRVERRMFSEKEHKSRQRIPGGRLISLDSTPNIPVPKYEKVFYSHATMPWDLITSIREFAGPVDCYKCKEEIEAKGKELTKMWKNFWSNFEIQYKVKLDWTDKPWELKLPVRSHLTIFNYKDMLGMWVSPTIDVATLIAKIPFWATVILPGSTTWQKFVVTELKKVYPPNIVIFPLNPNDRESDDVKLVFVLPGPSFIRSADVCNPCTCSSSTYTDSVDHKSGKNLPPESGENLPHWPPGTCYTWLTRLKDSGIEHYLRSDEGKRWATSGKKAADVLRSAWFQHWSHLQDYDGWTEHIVRNRSTGATQMLYTKPGEQSVREIPFVNFAGEGWHKWAENQGGKLKNLSKKLQKEWRQARPEDFVNFWPPRLRTDYAKALEYSKRMLLARGALSTWDTSQVVAWLRHLPNYIPGDDGFGFVEDRFNLWYTKWSKPYLFIDTWWIPRFIAHKVTGAFLKDESKSTRTIVNEIGGVIPDSQERMFDLESNDADFNSDTSEMEFYIMFWVQALKAAANVQQKEQYEKQAFDSLKIQFPNFTKEKIQRLIKEAVDKLEVQDLLDNYVKSTDYHSNQVLDAIKDMVDFKTYIPNVGSIVSQSISIENENRIREQNQLNQRGFYPQVYQPLPDPSSKRCILM